MGKVPGAFQRPAIFISHRHYLVILGAVFSVWWVAMAIAPLHRNPWLLENALVLAAVALLALFHRRLLFSRVSYTLANCPA